MFEIEYELRQEDLVHFNEMQLLKNPDLQNNLKKNRWLVPGIMILIGAYYYFYYGDRNTSGYIMILAVLWAVLSPKLMLLDLRSQILRSYTPQEKRTLFGTYTLSINPETSNYLIETSPSGKHKMPWADMVRVEYGKRYVYIYLDLNTALVIPVDTVKKGNLEQFAEQAEKMIERFG